MSTEPGAGQLDVCNALASAASTFFLILQSSGYSLPDYLLTEELAAETRSPWWEITGNVKQVIPAGDQLVLHVRVRTRDPLKTKVAAFQSGILAEKFSPGFVRYFFSLRSEQGTAGWAIFDGGKLLSLRQKSTATLEEYAAASELIIFPSRVWISLPRRFETLLQAFKLALPAVRSDINKKLRRSTVKARGAKIHRNSWGKVLNGSVHFSPGEGKAEIEAVRESCGRILAAAIKAAKQDEASSFPLKYLPLGFARISVFRKNYRQRRLDGFGLGSDLICTIQVRRIRRIKSPDILGATIENRGKYRIAWNKAYLEDVIAS